MRHPGTIGIDNGLQSDVNRLSSYALPDNPLRSLFCQQKLNPSNIKHSAFFGNLFYSSVLPTNAVGTSDATVKGYPISVEAVEKIINEILAVKMMTE